MGTKTFPTGTKTVFNSNTAPTGWTIDTTAAYHNASVRVVTGGSTGGSTGGTQAFTTVMTSSAPLIAPGPVTLDNPGLTGTGANVSAVQSAHTHAMPPGMSAYTPFPARAGLSLSPLVAPIPVTYSTMRGTSTPNPVNWNTVPDITSGAAVGAGGTDTHSHPLSFSTTTTLASGTANFGVQYVDFIIASIN